MLAGMVHIGSENSETTMMQYIYKRRNDGVNIVNINKTWEKMVLAARAIAAIENPADVFVVSSRSYGQRGVLKCARYIGATPIAGRFTPGAFTNQIQAAFREPRLLVIADPRADHQPVTEGSYANIPIISFANVDSPTKHIDIAIPCNNKGVHSIGLMWWFLTREVLRLRGTISRELAWDVMPDLFFYRDPEEAEKEEQARKETLAAAAAAQPKPAETQENWGGEEMSTDWANEPAPAVAAPAAAPAAAAAPYQVSDEWATQQGGGGAAVAPAAAAAPKKSDWADEPAEQPAPATGGGQWGGSTNWN
jgi:small subunit ribosomal protein SAe